MRRHDALAAAYPQLERRGTVVVTIMGAVAAELQSLGHRPNFFYLQHAMGLASSLGLGIALSRPELKVVVFDGDGSLLMNLGGLTTLARYRPKNLVHVLEQLVADLAAGRLKIVDLTQPLGPETPVIGLPPMFGASPGVTLDVITDHPPMVSGDQNRLTQLLDNLVSNAVKFTKGGGTVSVTISAENGSVRLVVADTGIGVANDEQGQMFSRFFRASTATRLAIPGTGLGLAICKGIVDAHDGRLEVHSALGRGTTVTVMVPLESAPGQGERDER